MQKHKKGRNTRNLPYKLYKYKKKILTKKERRVLRLKRLKTYPRRFQFLKTPTNVGFLRVRVSANNIFCVLSDVSTKKIQLKASAGKYKIAVSRKKLRHIIKPFFVEFERELKSTKVQKNLVVVLSAPKKIKRGILRLLPDVLEKKNLIFQANAYKCYNGCRPSKKKRRKRRRWRITKFL